MGRSPTDSQLPWQGNFSEIIDVRSPAEYRGDRIPGAINLPVLNNEERAKVGTIYKQVSPFAARKIGAALVAQNISAHLMNHFANKEKEYSALVYCWRGGQRSQSLGIVLEKIGWRVVVLEGGYKTYRAYIRAEMEKLPLQFQYRVLSGLTGTGKTYILRELAKRGQQVLDLEAIANHRGSLLGQEWQTQPMAQPSQKRFESLLVQELQKFDPNKTVWVEAESNKIGQLYLPNSLWQKLKTANCLELELPKAVRINWLIKQYPHLIDYPEVLKSKLQILKSRYGNYKIEEWFDSIERGQWTALVEDLLTHHYDPAYHRSLGKTYSNCTQKLPLLDLSESSIAKALDNLIQNFSS